MYWQWMMSGDDVTIVDVVVVDDDGVQQCSTKAARYSCSTFAASEVLFA